MVDRRAVLWFVGLAFAIAWALFLVPLAFGPVGSTGHQMAVLPAWSLAMWAPGVSALVVTRFVQRRGLGSLNLRRLGSKANYLRAWLVPVALSVLAGILTVLMGFGQLDLELRQITAAQPAWNRAPASIFVASQIAAGLTLGPLVNTLLALGEELGWRGFLLPSLLPLGQWRAIVLSGAIWGVWHAPAIAQGHNYPGQPVLGVFLMVAFCVTVGAVFSWLYLRTASPWAPALGHGSLNAVAGLPLLFIANTNIVTGGTLASVSGIIGLALFVGWLALTGRLPVPSKAISAAVPAASSDLGGTGG